MSKRTNKQTKRLASIPHRSLALLGLLLTLGSTAAIGEGLDAYGARMCEEAGIPLEECSFVADPVVTRDAELAGRGDKTATLLEHGRRVCEDENVPLEECQALPTGFRGEPVPPPAFLTVPPALPPVDAALLPAPAPAAAPAPIPAPRPVAVAPRPPLPPPARPAPPARILVDDPGIRYHHPPVAQPMPPAYAYGPAAAPVVALPPPPVYGYGPVAAPAIALPIDPGARYGPGPPPPPPFAFREAAPPPPPFKRRHLPPVFVEEHSGRFWRNERFGREERYRRDELLHREERFFSMDRFLLEERWGRCLRAVRYSPPPSYRYVTC